MRIPLPAWSERVYVVKCKSGEGKWIELDELNEPVTSREARDRYEDEIESSQCTRLKLEEYMVNREGERIKYVKKHWDRKLPAPRRPVDPESLLGATAFSVLQALEACNKLQSMLSRAVPSQTRDEFLEMLELIGQLRGRQAQAAPPRQAGPRMEPGMEGGVERLARELLEQQAMEFAAIDESKAPCARPGAECGGSVEGGGDEAGHNG